MLGDECKALESVETQRIAQEDFDEVFVNSNGFYEGYPFYFSNDNHKLAAFSLNQACEHAYKTVLLVFASECPQEHHLDTLSALADAYCPTLRNIFPQHTDTDKAAFECLNYAYIGARYDRDYNISREQLLQLAPCVETLHQVVEACCQGKIAELSSAT